MDVEQGQTIELPAVLDLAACDKLAEQLLSAMSNATSVLIEASDLRRITTPGAQVLISAEKLARRRGLSLRLSAPNPMLADAFATLGLTQAYHDLQGENP